MADLTFPWETWIHGASKHHFINWVDRSIVVSMWSCATPVHKTGQQVHVAGSIVLSLHRSLHSEASVPSRVKSEYSHKAVDVSS